MLEVQFLDAHDGGSRLVTQMTILEIPVHRTDDDVRYILTLMTKAQIPHRRTHGDSKPVSSH